MIGGYRMPVGTVFGVAKRSLRMEYPDRRRGALRGSLMLNLGCQWWFRRYLFGWDFDPHPFWVCEVESRC